MKRLSLFLALICLFAASTSMADAVRDDGAWRKYIIYDHKRPWWIFGGIPDKSVKNWTRLSVPYGGRNKPFPIVWIAPEKFKIIGFPEEQIVLSPTEYRTFTAFIRANKCSTTKDLYAWGNVEVAEFSKGHEQVLCRLPCKAAEQYLSRILAIPDIKWTRTKSEPFDDMEPIENLAGSLHCEQHPQDR